MGLPDFISFDHDLSDRIWTPDDDYEDTEKTGYDCAKWLVDYCLDHKLQIPEYAIHSMNSTGAERIMSYLKNGEKWTKTQKGF